MTYRYIPPFGLRVLQIIILIESLLRGIFYVLFPNLTLATTDVVSAAPLEVWGAAFIAFATLGLFGEALMSGVPIDHTRRTPRAWPSFLSHAGLMMLYLTLSLAYAGAAVSGEVGLSQAPAAILLIAYTHWMFARRRSHVT